MATAVQHQSGGRLNSQTDSNQSRCRALITGGGATHKSVGTHTHTHLVRFLRKTKLQSINSSGNLHFKNGCNYPAAVVTHTHTHATTLNYTQYIQHTTTQGYTQLHLNTKNSTQPHKAAHKKHTTHNGLDCGAEMHIHVGRDKEEEEEEEDDASSGSPV